MRVTKESAWLASLFSVCRHFGIDTETSQIPAGRPWGVLLDRLGGLGSPPRPLWAALGVLLDPSGRQNSEIFCEGLFYPSLE